MTPEMQKTTIIALETQRPGKSCEYVQAVTHAYSTAEVRNIGMHSYQTTDTVELAWRFSEKEAHEVCYVFFHTKHRVACPVTLPLYPCAYLERDTFFQCAVELAMVQMVLEQCAKFVEIESQLYGVLYRFPHAGELVPIRNVRRYWGYCPEETVETVRVPDQKEQWVTVKLPITRMAVVDAYLGHVQHFMDNMYLTIPQIAVHQE